MNLDSPRDRYLELRAYIGLTLEEEQRVADVAPRLEPFLPPLIDDFYLEIERHEATRRVITGGAAQIERLKATLLVWVRELLSSRHDPTYVERRRRVGRRHVEIGLDQVYTSAALSRLRGGLTRAVYEISTPTEAYEISQALDKLLDLDLAIIEDAYQAEYAERSRRAEQLETKRVREAGKASFRLLVETADCLIIIVNDNYTIAYISPYAERMTGVGDAGAREFDFRGLLATDAERAEAEGVIAQAIAGEARSGCECALIDRDGKRRHILWNVRRLAADHGVVQALLVGQDITPLKDARRQALQAARLAAIGQTMAGLAHESRNALQRGQACLEMLALEVRDRPEALRLIGRIQTAQDHLNLLFEDVRGYAAPIKLEATDCDLRAVWNEIWSQLESTRGGRTVALRDLTHGLDMHVRADPFRIGQVFRNVFENAIAASLGVVDPVVEIQARHAPANGRPALHIEIRDHGPGLDPEQRKNIFEPFYTTKVKGTGLGMPIARRIVEAHDGTISVGECNGPGASIVLVLPRGRL